MTAYEDAVARLSASVRRYELALEELRGADADLGAAMDACRKASKALVNGHARERSTNDWTVSEDVIAVVWANARALGGEFALRDLVGLTPYSRQTLIKALAALRSREYIRLVRTRPAKVYALMPEYADG